MNAITTQNTATQAPHGETAANPSPITQELDNALKTQFIGLCASVGLYFDETIGAYATSKSSQLMFLITDAEELLVLARQASRQLDREGK